MANVILDKIKAGALVVDVRTPDEFEDEAYEGAVNIPVNQINARQAELGSDKNRPLVLYCASGARSTVAAAILKGQGWTDVVNAGGLDDMPL